MQIDMIRKWELQYSDKIDFKTKAIKKDKEGHYIKDNIKGSIQEDFTLINIYAPNIAVVLVAQSCPTLCDPMDCSPPGSSVHEIFQARILEWVAVSFSRGYSQIRD